MLGALVVGTLAATVSAIGIGWALGASKATLASLAPKSVTAPVAMGLAERLGGEPALAAVFAVITGLIGAMSARSLFGILGVPTDARGWRTRGFALGTAAHGIGAARALQVQADAGAYAGLALGLQVIISAITLPWLVQLLR
jgi:putative effector of murein hydrolase